MSCCLVSMSKGAVTGAMTMTASTSATKRKRNGFPLGGVALMLIILFLFCPEPPQASLNGSIKGKLSSYEGGPSWQNDDSDFNLTKNGVPVVDDDAFLEYHVKPLDSGTNDSFGQRLYATLTSTIPFVVPKKSSNFNSRAVMFHLEEALLELENQTAMDQNFSHTSRQQGNETEQIPMTTVGNSSASVDKGRDDNATVSLNFTTRLRRAR